MEKQTFDTRKVKVMYYDSKYNHITTVSKLKYKYRFEDERFQKSFFSDLKYRGKAFSVLADYKLLK